MSSAPLPTRRRVLQLLATTAVAGVTPSPAASNTYEWTGTALGADARIVLSGIDQDVAEAVIEECRLEIERLEMIFSLHRKNSEVMRLNREGHLTLPSIELVQLLDLSRTLNRKTAGLFDPTIQPLWQLYGSLYETRAGKELPPHDAIAQRLQLIGLHHVHIEAGRIALDPDCSITLNGIAQGYITDRVAELLRRRGLDHILIDLGEVRALGPQPDGSPFRIAVPQSGLQVPLADAALAVSSPAGLLFAPEHGMGHILDPRTGSGRSPWRCIAVRHASAAVADGLSTAFVLADRAAITKTLQEVAGTRVWATRPDGSIETFA